jgi:hypothetical protein
MGCRWHNWKGWQWFRKSRHLPWQQDGVLNKVSARVRTVQSIILDCASGRIKQLGFDYPVILNDLADFFSARAGNVRHHSSHLSHRLKPGLSLRSTPLTTDCYAGRLPSPFSVPLPHDSSLCSRYVFQILLQAACCCRTARLGSPIVQA